MNINKLVIITALGMAVMSLSAMAAGISGTKHDMSGKGWGTAELCKFCHTPHLARPSSETGGAAPLWNHKTTTQGYTLYTSATFDPNGGTTKTQPGPQSKLCLSCHDGTVAIDAFANSGVLQTGNNFMTSTNLVGAGGLLTSDHPIAFTYNGALAASAKQLATPVSASWVDSAQTLPLYASKMECATCHAVHDNTYGKFLRVSNAGSAMCLTCHQK